jgi:predicted PurR-regulated permease PerM
VLSITKGIVGAVVGLVTIAFLTLFMVLEGAGVGRSRGRSLTGNLLSSVIAGAVSAIVLLLVGVPFPVALELMVALLYLIPLAGVLQPLVYGRTVELSPLAVLIAILIGTELAGVLGALGAIPIAGTM